MTESFLHYIWEFQYFDKTALTTSSGEAVSVLHPGYRNTHSGPDFFNSKIAIGGIEWVGNVEIHIESSMWYDHRHDKDVAYDNVILHVVWNDNQTVQRRDRSPLPTLSLKNRIRESLFFQYRKLINAPEQIPCATQFSNVSMLTKYSMMDKVLMQRLEEKARGIQRQVEKNGGDWEETAYQLLSKNFGFKVNNEPFEQLARAVPYKIILKHADQLHQVEALLFGQAGFLDDVETDEYVTLLRREFNFLSTKYSLDAKKMNKAQWKFLRLRPANFPTLRIAQLSSLLSFQKNIFATMIEMDRYTSLLKVFRVEPSAYWRDHYQFSKPLPKKSASFGRSSIENIVINTAIPLLVAYGKHKDSQDHVDRAISILQHISGEFNSITRTWASAGMPSKSAADSQGLIELYNNYCLKRRCLDCTIGFALLQPS